jgi:hypothetical protein
MWKFGFQFANESLLFGYGEEKNMLFTLKNSLLNIPENVRWNSSEDFKSSWGLQSLAESLL